MSEAASSRMGYGEAVFRSVGQPIRRALWVRIAVVLVLLVLTAAALAILVDQSFFFLAFVMALPLVAGYRMSGMSTGTIHLDHEGIVFKGSESIRLAWGDVERMGVTSIRAVSPKMAGINRLLGFDLDKPFVTMRLRKALRVNPITKDLSTRSWGIPSGFAKAVNLYPDDPQALLAAAEVHLQPGIHS